MKARGLAWAAFLAGLCKDFHVDFPMMEAFAFAARDGFTCHRIREGHFNDSVAGSADQVHGVGVMLVGEAAGEKTI